MFTFGDSRIPHRYWEKVTELPNGCWQWDGHRSPGGYGQCKAKALTGQRVIVAHRMFYLVLVGPIPDGLQLDHLCRHPSCVNPSHMEIVTARENTLRGTSMVAQNAQKTHCKRGHEFTSENTRLLKNDARECRQCRREADNARRHDPEYRRHWKDMRNTSRKKLMEDPEYRDRINEQQIEWRQRRGPKTLTPEERETKNANQRAYRAANLEHVRAVRRTWRQRREALGLPYM
jgi:hypothetical protein